LAAATTHSRCHNAGHWCSQENVFTDWRRPAVACEPPRAAGNAWARRASHNDLDILSAIRGAHQHLLLDARNNFSFGRLFQREARHSSSAWTDPPRSSAFATERLMVNGLHRRTGPGVRHVEERSPACRTPRSLRRRFRQFSGDGATGSVPAPCSEIFYDQAIIFPGGTGPGLGEGGGADGDRFIEGSGISSSCVRAARPAASGSSWAQAVESTPAWGFGSASPRCCKGTARQKNYDIG